MPSPHPAIIDEDEHDAHRYLRRAQEAGASEEKARAAAASLTGRDDRFNQPGGLIDQPDHRAEQKLIALSRQMHALERELAQLRLDLLKRDLVSLHATFTAIKADLRTISWMQILTIAGLLILNIRAFSG